MPFDPCAPPAWFKRAISTQPQSGLVTVDGTEIAYRLWPAGGLTRFTPLLLVHGGAAHQRWWDHVAPLLAVGRQVASIDLSGHGDSGHRDLYSHDLWAREALAVAADAFGTVPPVVIGHSMGGFVALAIGMKNSSAIAGLVTVDSPLHDESPEERAGRDQRAFVSLKRYPTREAAMERFRPMPVSAGTETLLPYIVRHVAGHSVRRDGDAWTWKFDPKLFNRDPMSPREVRRIARPIVMLRGQNGMVSPELVNELQVSLGPVPVVELPDTGHNAMLDQPLTLVATLRTVLAIWDL